MFVEEIKGKFNVGEPIFAKDILSLFPKFTKAYVFRLIRDAEKSGDLIRFSRGVYFIPKETFFGMSTLTSSDVADSKYISNGEDVYGIYSGLSLLNRFSISSQVPNVIEIITNNEATRKRIVNIDGMRFVLRKSRFEITKNNYGYYEVLQLFLELGFNPKFNDFSRMKIREHINENKLDKGELLKLAMKFPAQSLKNLISSGVLDAFNE